MQILLITKYWIFLTLDVISNYLLRVLDSYYIEKMTANELIQNEEMNRHIEPIYNVDNEDKYIYDEKIAFGGVIEEHKF